MRKLRIFFPVLTGAVSGLAYLAVKQDLKRKSEGKANFIDAIQKHGVELVKDATLREASIELLKKEASGVAEEISKGAEKVRNFLENDAKDLVENAKENAEEKIKEVGKEIEDILDVKDKI